MTPAVNLESAGENEYTSGTVAPISPEPATIIPRRYQLELLEKAKKENTIVYLETGCGKTLVAVMLLQHFSHQIRKPSQGIAVFLCPTVFLVHQQADVVRKLTDLKVGSYFGDMNVDAWTPQTWETEIEKCEVFVMTPQILLQNFHHCIMKMDRIEVLIFDECHHAGGRHPYACIMQEFYHTRTQEASYKLPRILGMTASPIDGKVARHGNDIDREFNNIECILDAKLYTVKERSELDLVVPHPMEEFKYYEPPNGTDLTTQSFATLLCNHKDECIRRLLGNLSSGDEVHWGAANKAKKKMVKSIEKLHNSLHYCSKELGLRCTYEAVNFLRGRNERNCEVKSSLKSDCKEAFLHAALKSLRFLLFEADNNMTSSAVLEKLNDTLHLSSKAQMLIDILKNYRDTKDMRCIIFVERKIATRALARLLSSIKCLSSKLQFESLAGKNAGVNGMNRKLQQQVVDSFRDGEVNVLVSTNVAEEGLDIRSCRLVIRFDLPKTPCSLIQSRGRARCLDSTYIYLVERNNNEQLGLLQQFRENEESMKGIALSRIAPVEDLGAPETSPVDTFRVESTQATISTYCCVSLLHRYCARLAHDSFFNPIPEFSYSEGSWGVNCTVTFPTDAHVQRVEGRATCSQADAKRVACFDACKLLYEAGALTDLLLLRSDENEYPSVTIIPKISQSAEKLSSPLHSTIVPDAFGGTWGAAVSGVALYAYTLCFVPTPNDRDYINFGLFLESDLGPEAGNFEVELQLTNRRLVNVKCSPSGRVWFEPFQLRNAKLFQERLFSAVLDQKPGSKLLGEWRPDRLYLLLPLGEKLESPSLPINWECVEKLISDVDYKIPNVFSPDVLGGPMVKLSDGFFPADYVLDSVVQTVHNGCFYCARNLIAGLNAKSPMVMKTRYTSYSDYYEKKHNTILQHLEQPMLKAKPLIQVHNLLTQRTTSERPAAEEQKTEALVELPLELCRIKVRGLSCGLANGASLLPSFMHRLEGLLLAIQLRQTLSLTYPEASEVPANLMLEAITTSKCQESFSLEGLELLGDAYLEVAVSEHLFLVHNKLQEGKLSKLRTSIICNSTLERLGKEKSIMSYIRDVQFIPSDWAAPGRVTLELDEGSIDDGDVPVHPRNRVKRTMRKEGSLQGKTIADVVEALIGAHYIQGGGIAAQSIMRWFGCEVSVDSSIRDDARMRTHGQVGLLPESNIVALEKLLNYKFRNNGLLVEALTHASCLRTSGDCYQRLEFLGDAVLDFLITKHFYYSVHSANLKRDPGLLTDLRSAAVNNECFARVAVRHNLHLYLLHSSHDLATFVNQYVKLVQDSMTEAESCHGWAGDGNPKVLSDLVESLAGAVFLDSNFDLNTVWEVFKQILRPLVTPENLRLEPTRELRELCQFEKFGEPVFQKEHGSRGNFVMTVTVNVKGQKITEVAQKPGKKSAEKAAAIQALARLKDLGYEHFSSRLLKRKALYTKTFSELVAIPEEGSSAVTTPHECIADRQYDVDEAAGSRDVEVIGGLCARALKKCNTGPNYPALAQMPAGGDVELETHIPSSDSNSFCGSEVLSGKEDLVQPGSEEDRFSDFLSGISDVEDNRILDQDTIAELKESENAPRFLESGLNFQRQASPQFEICSTTSLNKVVGNPSLEKRCLAFRTSSSLCNPDGIQSTSIQDSNCLSSTSSTACFIDQNTPQDSRSLDVSENMKESSCPPIHPSVLAGLQRNYFLEMNTQYSPDQVDHLFQDLSAQPRPAPGKRRPMEKGEARSLLNELCVRRRWNDPVYTCVLQGGLSHARQYTYVVTMRFSLGEKSYEIDAEGKPTGDVKGAKDSAAAQALVWFQENGIFIN